MTDFVEWGIRTLRMQGKETPSWTGVEKEDLRGGVPDRTPGMWVSGEDWQEHSQWRNSMSQSSKTSSVWAAWIDGWGGGACRVLRREEAGTDVWIALEMCCLNLDHLSLNLIPFLLPTPSTLFWVYTETPWENATIAMSSQWCSDQGNDLSWTVVI